MAKWQNYSFRESGLGYAGPANDPQDADNVTHIIDESTPGYPYTDGLGDNLEFGRNGWTNATNTSAGNAGNNTLLGGFATMSAAGAYVRIAKNPGTYDFRIALGASSSVAQGGTLFEGSQAQLEADIGGGGVNLSNGIFHHAANRAQVVGDVVAAPDLGFWRCTTAGTTNAIASPPSGAGPTHTDGTVVWTRTSRNALTIHAGTTSGGASVVHQNGGAVAASSWAAQAPVTVTLSGNYGNSFTWLRLRSVTGYPRQIGFRLQVAALQDVTLFDNFGDSSTSAPEFWALQAPGKKLHRIAPATGASSIGNFALSGDLAPYLALATIDGSVWIVAGATRMPDNLAGTRSLTVTQTDLDAPPPTSRNTTFTCTVVSSQGRPTTGLLGLIDTRHWLLRKRAKDVLATGLWKGHSGQAFASDVAVSDAGSFVTAWDAVSPDGSSWYRIRLQNGSYEGQRTLQFKDFGTGGIVIEPDSGHDPEFACGINGFVVRGLHIRGLRLVCDKSRMGLVYQWRFSDPGPANGYFNRFAFTGNRIGVPQGSQSNDYILTNAGNAVFAAHGESAYFKDNIYSGNDNPGQILAVRCVEWDGDHHSWYKGDLRKVNANYLTSTTKGVFADDHQYVNITNTVTFGAMDYAGFSSGAHVDWMQIATFQNNASYIVANSGPDGTAAAWTLNREGFFAGAGPKGRVYRVAAVSSAGLCGATLPTGTGNGFVSGDVTWDYVGENTTDDTIIVMEGNLMDCQSTATASTTDCQFLINSNDGHNSRTYTASLNNLIMTTQSRGLQGGDGTHWAAFNSFIIPSAIFAGHSVNPGYIYRSGSGVVDDYRNILAGDVPLSGGKYSRQDSVKVDFGAGAAVGTRPQDLLLGGAAFVLNGDSTWRVTNLSGTLTGNAARTSRSVAYHHNTGLAGARLYEERTLTVDGLSIALQVSA